MTGESHLTLTNGTFAIHDSIQFWRLLGNTYYLNMEMSVPLETNTTTSQNLSSRIYLCAQGHIHKQQCL